MERKRERDGYKKRLSDPGENLVLIVVIRAKLDDFGFSNVTRLVVHVGGVSQGPFPNIQGNA